MKLQVNLKGSWRDVLPAFPEKHEQEVRDSAGRLAFLAGGKIKFRIADDANCALAYCEAPFFTWKNAFRGAFFRISAVSRYRCRRVAYIF